MARVTRDINSRLVSRCVITSVNFALACCLAFVPACATRRQPTVFDVGAVHVPAAGPAHAASSPTTLTSYRRDEEGDLARGADASLEQLAIVGSQAYAAESLASLEALAQSMNPQLRRLSQEAAAAEAKTHYADKLPDPTVGANIFAHPIETAAGSQRANLSVMQMIPWLSRLDAQSQQAFFEALSLQQVYNAERLKVVGSVRTLWYRLYILGKQIETNRGNQQSLQLLIEVANARISTGQASSGDVLLGTLELSKLAGQILTFEQQLVSTKAELNRIIGRDTDHPLDVPTKLEPSLPDWTHGMLRQIAWEQQPEIAAAELRIQATNWGLEVARLKRRPDLSLSASWFAIDDNRPASNVVDVGRDGWSIGAQLSVPLWHHKYDAIEEEAEWKHSAAHASVDDVMHRYDSLLRDLWERAKTAEETAELYTETLLPQARQTLNVDRESYSNGTVEFDRVVRDFRGLLMLELGYYRAIGELAVALARIQQAVGTDLASTPTLSGDP